MTRRRPTEAQLRKAVERLKRPLRATPPPKERRSEIKLRISAREQAEARLRQIESARIRYEVYDEPHVRRELDKRISNRVAEVELREHLRGEPEPLPESASPARAALATSADERRSEMVWTQYTPNGWGAPE